MGNLFVFLVFLVLFGENFSQSLTDFVNPLQTIAEKTGLSEKNIDCYNDLRKALSSLDLTDSKNWASRMLDANNRIMPSGVFYGNYFSLGNFDECLSIAETVEETKIYGKHCTGTIPMNTLKSEMMVLNDRLRNLDDPNSNQSDTSDFKFRMIGGDRTTLGIQLGFCVPSSCKAEDLQATFDGLTFHDKYCRSNENRVALSGGAIASIVIYGIFIGIALISTIYDSYLFYTNKKTSHELYIAFSLLTNGRKLIKSNKNPDQLLCLNGLKAISMMWVILGHVFTSGGFIENLNDTKDWIKDKSSYFLLGATVSVDTFFAVGGLVVVYVFMKAVDKGVKFNIFQYYIHRYLRLTPALAAVVLFYCFLIEYTGNGILWVTVEEELRDVCRKRWWSTLLYVQNYVNTDEQYCIGQSWYLSVDMQLFILTPLVLIPLKKWPKIAKAELILLIVAGIVSPFAVAWHDKVIASMIYHTYKRVLDPLRNSMSTYYVATHTRFGPYVIGMLTGYIIYRIKKEKYKLPVRTMVHKLGVLVFWALLLAGMLACVFGQSKLDTELTDRWANSMHIALNRNAWAAGVCLVILACTLGYGGPIDTFLSASVFQLITKLSYSMYITHLGIIRVIIANSNIPIRFGNGPRLFEYWGYLALTIALSIPLCLVFESPVITLEKLIFKPESKKDDKKINAA